MKKVIRKRFDLSVTKPGETVKEEFELDKTITKVVGIAVTSDRDDLLFYRGSHRIALNGEEIFPEGYESKLLMSGIGVKPNDRYFRLEREPGNSMVQFHYTDSNHPSTIFTAYRVSLYIEGEI